jgi:GTP-binding protein HflX
MYNNAAEPDCAILVGVGVNETVTESDLDELSLLCDACNIKTVGRAVQNRHGIDVTYYIGSGKVYEIADLIKQTRANTVVFDVELSGSKVRNLEKALDVPVLDRSKVILDIFASRAKTAEGKLQVELAQLKYNLPRLAGNSGLTGKMRNAVGMRGPGESKLELDRRLIRDRILSLEKKLKSVAKNREISRRSAAGAVKPHVCLVGYTNSGKSTLLNTITKAGAYAEDELFATLDTTTRSVYLGGISAAGFMNDNPVGSSVNTGLDDDVNECDPRTAATERHGIHKTLAEGAKRNIGNHKAYDAVLLTDTVGFINKLPHEFIHAFESTLAETRDADLLLHIVDASNPDCVKQIAVVNEVLKNIGAAQIPRIIVYNKIDKTPHCPVPADAIPISAQNNVGIDKLKDAVLRVLF